MDIDVTKYIGAVAREVTTREHQGRPARVVRMTRTYDTSIEDLWDALTNAERLPRWFLPVEGDLRVGGKYQLKGNAGGTITRCDAPSHLAITWEFAGQTSWVDVRLDARPDGGTRLVLEHAAPEDPGDGHLKKYGPGAVGVGWDLSLIGLALHLLDGAPVDPAKFEAWTVSDPGKAFVRASSDGWRDASIAGGMAPAEATAAAARTAAFFTGEPEPPEPPGGA